MTTEIEQARTTKRLLASINELTRIFKTAPSKHAAHDRSRPLLQEMSADRSLITAILWRYLSTPGVLDENNYPAVGIDIELNPYYHLVANCWIPRPNRETNISTKSIHHHGHMLLTTVALFGPGYEHWLFTRPRLVDPDRELYEMDVVERKRHSLHHLAFVDAWIPHLPVYPERLSITLCLWSSQHRTTWRDYVKRIPFLKDHDAVLRQIAACAGLGRALDLKVINYFDYYPKGDEGFKGMKNRIEYARGPNEDHLHSVFHVLQETQHDRFAPLITRQLESGRVPFRNPDLIKRLVQDLERGRPIEGRLSACHLSLPHATFTTEAIEETLAVLRSRRGGPLRAESAAQAAPHPAGSAWSPTGASDAGRLIE